MRLRPLSLAALLVACLPAVVVAAEYPDPSRWRASIGAFLLEDEIIGERPGAIVATGSSSMLFWDHRIREDLAPLTVISRGFGGSNMNDVLTYLDQLVLKHAPRAVMIYAGDNDVAQEVPVPTILAAFEAGVERLVGGEKPMRVYLLSVKPSLARAALWPLMEEVNAGLRSLAAAHDDVTYIDVATPMLKENGSAREDLFVSDGLHMNQAGYDIWRNTVAPILISAEVRFEPSTRPR